MTFENVIWNDQESLDGYKVQRMIANDNVNYNLSVKSPKGLLACINFSQIPEERRTFRIQNASTFQTIERLTIYNKNVPKQYVSSKTNLVLTARRYYRVCISDLVLTASSPNSNSISPSSSFARDDLNGIPRDRQIILKFEGGGDAVEYFSSGRPAFINNTAGAANAQIRWPVQNAEFILAPLNTQDFELVISGRYNGYLTQFSGQPKFAIERGLIWVEDAGGVPDDSAFINLGGDVIIGGS
jgi:hypothetical protein